MGLTPAGRIGPEYDSKVRGPSRWEAGGAIDCHGQHGERSGKGNGQIGLGMSV